MEGKKRTEIAEIGKFGLIERICSRVEPQNASTVKGCGDDTAVIDAGDRYVLLSTELLLEGVHFDLTYYPLQHLGYKAVIAGISDILAMNGTPRQIELALGIPARFSVEMVDRLYDGVRAACDRYRTDLAGGDTTASVNGLAIGVTAAGDVAKDRIAYRSGAKPNDLICLSGDLGAAYMGLHLLEREKRACGGQPDPKPKFEGHEYILGRQLKPEARTDIIERLAGARIYLDRLPIARQTHDMAEELHADPVVAALNGGQDYELLFTVPLSKQQEIFALGVDVIGHVTAAGTGAMLVTPDGSEIALKAPGWK